MKNRIVFVLIFLASSIALSQDETTSLAEASCELAYTLKEKTINSSSGNDRPTQVWTTKEQVYPSERFSFKYENGLSYTEMGRVRIGDRDPENGLALVITFYATETKDFQTKARTLSSSYELNVDHKQLGSIMEIKSPLGKLDPSNGFSANIHVGDVGILAEYKGANVLSARLQCTIKASINN